MNHREVHFSRASYSTQVIRVDWCMYTYIFNIDIQVYIYLHIYMHYIIHMPMCISTYVYACIFETGLRIYIHKAWVFNHTYRTLHARAESQKERETINLVNVMMIFLPSRGPIRATREISMKISMRRWCALNCLAKLIALI